MSDADLQYVAFPTVEVRAMPDGSIAALREPLPDHEQYIDVVPPSDAEDPKVQRRSVRRDDGLPPSAEPAPRTPEERLLLDVLEFGVNGCATDLRAVHRLARTDHEPDPVAARAMALRALEVGLRRGLLQSGMFVRAQGVLAFVGTDRTIADQVATLRSRYVSAPGVGESDEDLAATLWLMNAPEGERYARTHGASAQPAAPTSTETATPSVPSDDPAVVVRSSSDAWDNRHHELLADNVFEELRNGWLSWEQGIEDAALRKVAWGVAAEIVYAFDVTWSPNWVPQGHPHRWHDDEGWHARCNDCLAESPAEAEEAVAWDWFATHRAVVHGDAAPAFRPSPPPIEVPLPGDE
ncbi:hypothetical protein [Curtobacterium sp. HSID17257]|uniref:hypothetical protein n=1 Tax=Curtobacterium sp. HSID17257 TaxID=2419510 RepID=UPI000F895117|nr:hypothetical protein [Curtobacterium sp. HSID17257]